MCVYIYIHVCIYMYIYIVLIKYQSNKNISKEEKHLFFQMVVQGKM